MFKSLRNGSVNKVNATWAGVLIGFSFPLLTAVFLFFSRSYQSLEALYADLRKDELYIIICSAPFILAFVLRMLAGLLESKFRELRQARDEQIETVLIASEFAEKVGKKDYSSALDFSKDSAGLLKALSGMRDSLRRLDETEANEYWMNTLELEVSALLAGIEKKELLSEKIIRFICNRLQLPQGAIYFVAGDGKIYENTIYLDYCYAYNRKKHVNFTFPMGEGLVGQAIANKEIIFRNEIPVRYLKFSSGILGDLHPTCLLIIPLYEEDSILGAIEFLSVQAIPLLHLRFLERTGRLVSRVLYSLQIRDRTLHMLNEANRMRDELSIQREQLIISSEEIEDARRRLSSANEELRKQINEVSNSRKRLQVLLENASEVITILDASGIVRFQSPGYRMVFGTDPELTIGKAVFPDLHSSASEPFHIFLERLIQKSSSEPAGGEFTFLHPSGERKWCEVLVRDLSDDPAIRGIVLNSRDVTMKKKAEWEELRSGQMRALSENSPDLIIRINQERKVVYINPALHSFSVVHAEHCIDRSLMDSGLAPEFLSALFQDINVVFSTSVKKINDYNFHFNNMEVFLRGVILPELEASGKTETVLFVGHDITPLKQQEFQIISKNKSITESIRYAYTIQSSLVAGEQELKRIWPHSFLYYKPRDIVSGDFPWIYKREGQVWMAAVDCTGHGVPGALMSLIGYFTLNQVISQSAPEDSTGTILDRLHDRITAVLKQDQGHSKDGMDIALVKIEANGYRLEFSGAHRPLLILKDKMVLEIRGEKFPIGGLQYRNRKPYATHALELSKGDGLFLFTDGLTDQFGGSDKGERFQTSRLKACLEANAIHGVRPGFEVVVENFEKWMGDNRQLDDILLMAIEL